MTRTRNMVAFGLLLLAWIYFYVPNPLISFLTINDESEPAQDLLFLWIPIVLGAAAYLAHTASWPWRLSMSVAPPLLALTTVFLLAATGLVYGETGRLMLLLLVLPLRAFIIALAVTALLTESVIRCRKTSRPPPAANHPPGS